MNLSRNPVSPVTFFAWIVLLISASAAQDNCQQVERCDLCIQTPGCMWCSSPKMGDSEDGERIANCQSISVNIRDFCDLTKLENPKNHYEVINNIPLTTVDGEKTSKVEEEKIIQLSPQGIKMKLRKGTPQKVSVTYRQAQGYPVDLYILMDLSETMEDDKQKLADLGKELTSKLSDLTTKFSIGFGSFVDKLMMPFAYTSPDKINNPCGRPNCTRPYSFRNRMPLAKDPELFIERVTKANISKSIDGPEGGFDALMQAMVCKEAIGWRNQSRRIIILSTDDKSHFAGDGRLAGVVTPNDEDCHLNEDQEYDLYDEFDYPSIAQINKIATRENINIIFAVSEQYKDMYREISNMIETSSYGVMNSDSSNIIELVVDQYNQITSVVRLSDNATDSPVAIHYTSNCLNSTSEPTATQECSGISQGEQVTFNLEVTANECSKDSVIVEVKTLQDSLFLEIEFDCSCDCEKTQGQMDNSSICSYQGSLVCGVCDCFSGYQGENCMCSTLEEDESQEDERLCKAPGEDRVCSGRGNCICGACNCQGEEISGKYCQCNSRMCLFGTDEVCSGHGKCDCNECTECDPSYQHGPEGNFCQCPTEQACVKPGTNGEVCSGHGTCHCGECKCKESYSGQYCEDCLVCDTAKCSEFEDCVQCLFQNPQCECNRTTTPVESLKQYVDRGAQECGFMDDEDGCWIKFSYMFGGQSFGYDLHVLKNKECPEEAPIMGIVFGLVATIVFIGLLTLIIWKVVTSIHDRKEFARFEDERKKGTWSIDNELYREPTQTTQNPLYQKT